MGQVIGNAADFYRLRVIRVDEGELPEMEWRDDILYRRQFAEPPKEFDLWRVEVLDVDTDEVLAVIATFDTAEDADRWMDTVSEDLVLMTRSEFERTYFTSKDEDRPSH